MSSGSPLDKGATGKTNDAFPENKVYFTWDWNAHCDLFQPHAEYLQFL